MYRIMITLVEVGFRGCAIAGRVPGTIGGRNAGWADSIACTKAYFERAGAEAGKKKQR
jgi:hypothetical protein